MVSLVSFLQTKNNVGLHKCAPYNYYMGNMVRTNWFSSLYQKRYISTYIKMHKWDCMHMYTCKIMIIKIKINSALIKAIKTLIYAIWWTSELIFFYWNVKSYRQRLPMYFNYKKKNLNYRWTVAASRSQSCTLRESSDLKAASDQIRSKQATIKGL